MIRKIICLLAALCTAIPIKGLRDAMIRAYVPEFDQTELFHQFAHGSLGVYLSPAELHQLMTMIVEEFADVVRPIHVG